MGRLATAARSVFVHDLRWKLLSLAIAIVLYAMVHGAENVQRSFTVPVLVTVDESGDRMLVSEVPDSVKVVVAGRSTVVDNLKDIDPIVVDLRGDVGAAYHYIDPDSVRLPAGVQVVRIVPDAIPLRWDRRAVLRRPVRPVLVGTPLEGFEARVRSVSPGQVRFEGPLRVLERHLEAPTEPLDVSGLAPGRHERWVPIERVHPLVRIDPPRVQVTLEVVPRRIVRRLSGLAVQVPAGWQADPPTVAVELSGPPELVGSLAPLQLRVELTPPPDGEPVPPEGLVPRLQGLPQGVEARLEPSRVRLVQVRNGAGRSTLEGNGPARRRRTKASSSP